MKKTLSDSSEKMLINFINAIFISLISTKLLFSKNSSLLTLNNEANCVDNI